MKLRIIKTHDGLYKLQLRYCFFWWLPIDKSPEFNKLLERAEFLLNPAKEEIIWHN